MNRQREDDALTSAQRGLLASIAASRFGEARVSSDRSTAVALVGHGLLYDEGDDFYSLTEQGHERARTIPASYV